MAIIKGVDIVDTAILSFAGGPAAPSFEIIQIFCNKLGIETGVNLDAVVKINKELIEIRKEMKDVDSYQLFPIEFDLTKDTLPTHIDKLFDDAIEFANAEKFEELQSCCLAIEKHFNFPEPDENVKFAEVPGGMYTNMLAQLKQLKLEQLLPRVLEIIPTVRLASGCPPLVTPTSQIVGVQAVNCVIDENKGVPFYTNKSIQYVNLVKGLYGKTPIPVDPEFRLKIAGIKEETPYDTSHYQKQPNPVFTEFGNAKLAGTEKEELLLELFPSVAEKFLKDRIVARYMDAIRKEQDKKRKAIEDEKRKYEAMSNEEKRERLITGLFNAW